MAVGRRLVRAPLRMIARPPPPQPSPTAPSHTHPTPPPQAAARATRCGPPSGSASWACRCWRRRRARRPTARRFWRARARRQLSQTPRRWSCKSIELRARKSGCRAGRGHHETTALRAASGRTPTRCARSAAAPNAPACRHLGSPARCSLILQRLSGPAGAPASHVGAGESARHLALGPRAARKGAPAQPLGRPGGYRARSAPRAAGRPGPQRGWGSAAGRRCLGRHCLVPRARHSPAGRPSPLAALMRPSGRLGRPERAWGGAPPRPTPPALARAVGGHPTPSNAPLPTPLLPPCPPPDPAAPGRIR